MGTAEKTPSPPEKKKRRRVPSGFRWKPPVSLSKDYFTRREAAEFLGCSDRYLDKQISADRIETVKYNGNHTLVSKLSLRQFVAERTGDGLPPAEVKAKRRAKRA